MRISVPGLVLLGLCGLATASAAGEFAKPPSGGVPNHYIVVLDDAAPQLKLELGDDMKGKARAFEAVADDLRRDHSLRRSSLLSSLGILVIEADERAARGLLKDPRVLLVEQDVVGEISVYQQCYEQASYQHPLANSFFATSPQWINCWDPQISCSDNWGLDRIDQRNGDVWAHTTDFSYSFSATGNGVHIYIADSGIAWNHEEFLASGGGNRIGNGASFVPTELDTYDNLGHGTHVAGIAGGRRFGVAKQATLHPVRGVLAPPWSSIGYPRSYPWLPSSSCSLS